MKKLIYLPTNKYLISLFILLLLNFSCSKDEIKLDCAAVYCTTLFHQYSIDIMDQNGNPIVLDKYLTIRERNRLEIDIQSKLDSEADLLVKESGNYPVLSDAHANLIKYEDEKFTFKGYQNNNLIVSVDFIFSKNCCGVVKITGPEEFTVD